MKHTQFSDSRPTRFVTNLLQCAGLAMAIMLPLSAAAEQIIPTNLLCEAKSNPIGLSEPSPRLSWIEMTTVPGARGQFQTAYQIQAASSLQLLTNNQGDLWDTGQVFTNQMSQIAYAGTALSSHQVCFWRVRVWDQNGQPSAWSSPASWTMGLLTTGEWTAQWIGRDDAPGYSLNNSTVKQAKWIWYPEGNPAASAPVGTRWFRKAFVVPQGVSVDTAKIIMTADDSFTLYVNGQAALSGSNWKNPVQADVSKFLLNGTNVLAVAAVNAGTSSGPAGLIGALDLVYNNGQTNSLQTDGTWITTSTQPAADWYETDFAATGWTNALVLGAYGMSPWSSISASAKTYYAATMLRKDFELPQLPVRAVLYVTGQGIIEPHLNGEKVGEDYFLPGYTDYAIRLYYQTYDVTALLRQGTNTLGAILGDGWYRGNIHSSAGDLQNNYGTKLRLLSELHLFYADGRHQVITSDPSWQAGFGPIIKNDRFSGEIYDARREPAGWDSPGFANAAWENVTTGAENNPLIQAFPDEPVRTYQTLAPVSITQPQPGIYVLNFGQNISGWARLQVTNQSAGNQITMNFGECLSTDGTVYLGNLQVSSTSPMQQDTYICKGGDVETWEPRFTTHGFQFVQVQGLVQAPTTNTIKAVVVHSELPEIGSFQCSDPLLNQINSNMVWTLRNNYISVPLDCPQRDERSGWCDGAFEIMRSGLFNMDGENFYSKWEQDIVDSAARVTTSDFAQLAPVIVSGAGDSHFSAAWNSAVVIVPYWVYRTYGDTRLVARVYTNMVRHMNYFAANSSSFIGPVGTYGDWMALDGTTSKQFISTAFYAGCASMMAEMAQALGKTSDAAAYRLLFTNICSAFQSNYVAADGTVGSGSQTCYALAFEFNLLTPAQRLLAATKFAAAIDAKGGHPSTGMVGTRSLLPALTGIDRSDLAYQLLGKTDYPSWGYWIGLGATTMWEAWNAVTNGDVTNGCSTGLSLNHANFGSCTEWFYSGILGIDQLLPGFKKTIIRPQIGGGLNWAQGSYNSISGPIVSAWQFNNNQLTLNVSVPVNVTAEIHVPTTNANAITESGILAAASPGVTYFGVSNGCAIYQVGSGNYVWSSSFQPIVAATNQNPLFSFATTQGSPVLGAATGVDTNSISVALVSGLTGPATVVNITNCATTLGRFYNTNWAGFSVFGSGTGNGTTPATADNFTTLGAYTFSIATENHGPLLYLSSLSFWGARGNNTGIRGFEVFAGVNGVNDFNSDLVTNVPNMDTAYTRSSPNLYLLDLSGTRYQGIHSITVRFIPLTTSSQTVEFGGFTIAGGIGATLPTITAPRLSGNNLIIMGSGGTPNAYYTWLDTTNLKAPVIWMTNSIGMLDDAGSFSNTLPIGFSDQSRYFRLRIP